MKEITITSSEISVRISSMGAELQSIRDRDGQERLWQGNPAFFAGRAPILFPVAGGFRDDCYWLNGKRYPMPKHGFVRRLDWTVEQETETQTVFLMTEKNEGFPFHYELRALFSVQNSTLTVSYIVSSNNETPFYFGLGSHEAYATPGGIEDYELVFDEPERLDVYPLEGNLTLRKPWLLADNTRTLPLKQHYFAVDALVFRTLRSRGVTLQSKQNAHPLRVEYPNHPVLMLWTKPGAEYLCIEPWCNGPDYVDADINIEKKFGFIRLNKGDTVTRTHRIILG